MKLLELEVHGFRGLADDIYSFDGGQTGVPHDVTLVTGPPGSGKSALLDAIAVAKEAFAAYGLPVDVAKFARSGAKTSLAATWRLTEIEANRVGVAPEQRTTVECGPEGTKASGAPLLRFAWTRLSRDGRDGKIELFPANRTLMPEAWRIASSPLSMAIEDGRRLTKDPEKYVGVRRVLYELGVAQAASAAARVGSTGIALLGDEPDALAAYKEAVAKLVPDLRLSHVDVGEGIAEPWFKRRNGQDVTLEMLSASEEQAVLLAWAFAWLCLENSIVLIDEPELHLHPARHVEFLKAVGQLGSGNQIIAATTSAALLRSVPAAQVLTLAPECHEV